MMRNLFKPVLNVKLLLAVVTFVLPGLFLGSCESADDDEIILVAVNPASIEKGEIVVVELSSLKPVFTKRKVWPVASDGNLIIREITMVDATHALASIGSANVAGPGVHRFELDFGDKVAAFEISVINPELNSGTVQANMTEATAGAYMATMEVVGKGTRFDNDVTAEVIGAPGLQIIHVDTLTESRLDILFNISREQAPTSATIRLHDGAYSYDIPLNIVPAMVLQNTFTTQYLTKGQVGQIDIGAPNAVFDSSSTQYNEYTNFEIGYQRLVDGHRITVPVRVDFNDERSQLEFEYYTYLNDGAVLQVMQVSVELLEPAYIAVTPSVVTREEISTYVTVIGENINMSEVTSVDFSSDENVSITGFTPLSRAAIELDLLVATYALEGFHSVAVSNGKQTLYAGLVLDNFAGGVVSIHSAKDRIAAGDHIYLNVVTLNNRLENELTATGDEYLDVVGITRIDDYCLILELQADAHAPTGEYASRSVVTVHDGAYDFNVSVQITDSEL